MSDAVPALQQTWQSPPPVLTLKESEVHLWQASLDVSADLLTQLARSLSADERDRANRFKFAQHRQAYVAARGILRQMLAAYLQANPAHLCFQYGDRGKPALVSPNPLNLSFNLSHSNNLALYAVTRHVPVGVDVECLRSLPDADKLAERFFTPQEATLLKAMAAADRERLFFKLWTCKEAYLKAIGEGIAGLHTVEISLGLPVSEPVLRLPYAPHTVKAWSLQTLDLGDRYLAALAVKLPKFVSQTFRFPT
ncbi:MAG: 4'-phosphopantetheinyl transferase superfamily protein [Synechococcales bacterium]|nr:4'-phosphopantetheinyl transferase superfamily protein [Synechococcales bacterium]